MVEYDYGQGTTGDAYDPDRIDFALGRVYRIASDDATPLVYVEYSYLGDGTIVSVAHPEVLAGLQMTVGTGDGQINVGQTVYNLSGGSPTGAVGVVVGQTDDYWWIQVTTGTWSETGVISLEASGTPANYMSYTDSDDAAGLALTYGQPDDADGGFAGLDRFGRVIDQRWSLGGTTDAGYADGYAVDHYSYTYDRNSNRLTRANEIDSDFSEAYTYDGLNRLIGAARGGQGYQTWTLDALGNWSGSWFDADADGQVDQGESQGRSTNEANEIVSMTGRDAGDPAYDSAGNMIFDGNQHYRYDAWNRLTQAYADEVVAQPPPAVDLHVPGDLIAVYQYDGRGYRTAKSVATYTGPAALNPGGYDRTDYYYNISWQVVEERFAANISSPAGGGEGEGNPHVQYVWDIRYIDSPVCRFRDMNADGDFADAGDETVYYATDANMCVTALIDPASGNVIERYYYDPYGRATILDGSGWGESAEIDASAYANEITYDGYRFDPETGLYHVRNRYYDSTLAVWISRDPAGYGDGMSLLAFCRNHPIGATDPTGLGYWIDDLNDLAWRAKNFWNDTVVPEAQRIWQHEITPSWKAVNGDYGDSGREEWWRAWIAGYDKSEIVISAAIKFWDRDLRQKADAIKRDAMQSGNILGMIGYGANEYTGKVVYFAPVAVGASVLPASATAALSSVVSSPVVAYPAGGYFLYSADQSARNMWRAAKQGDYATATERLLWTGTDALFWGQMWRARFLRPPIDYEPLSKLPMCQWTLPGEKPGSSIASRFFSKVSVPRTVVSVPPRAGSAPSSRAIITEGLTRVRSNPTVAVTDTIGDLRAAGLKDAHHVIQDAAVRNLPGYDTMAARGVRLPGPSTALGTPHYRATQVQRQAGGGIYAAERRIGYKALRRAGWSEAEARQAIQEADDHFFSIGVRMDTPTAIPGNR